MLKKLAFKTEYLLVLATIILLLISYRFAFKNTITAWRTNSKLRSELTQNTNVSYQPGYIQRKNNNLDKIINLYKADTIAFRSNIISIISLIAEKTNVKLSSVPVQDVAFNTDQYIIEKLDFEGDYFSLLKLSNTLQSTNNIGMVRSEAWKTIDVRSKADATKKLVLEVYLEIAK